MIDINNIVNTAIQQEINKAITNYVDAYMADVQQEHRRQIAAMREEVEQLKQQRADSPAPNFTGQEVTALQLCITHETSPVYNAICRIARDVAVATAEEVMDEHKEEYDHDSYDSAASAIEDANLDSLPDFDEFVKYDDLGSAVEDKLNEIVDMDEYVKTEDLPDFDEFVTQDDLPEFPDVDTLVTKDDLFDAVREAVRDTVENRVSVSLHLS